MQAANLTKFRVRVNFIMSLLVKLGDIWQLLKQAYRVETLSLADISYSQLPPPACSPFCPASGQCRPHSFVIPLQLLPPARSTVSPRGSGAFSTRLWAVMKPRE